MSTEIYHKDTILIGEIIAMIKAKTEAYLMAMGFKPTTIRSLFAIFLLNGWH